MAQGVRAERRDDALVVTLDPSWSARRVAAALLNAASDYYGKQLPVHDIHAAMDVIWLSLLEKFNNEELRRLRDITHVSLPMGDLSASITLPPSQRGYFIVFDALLDLRLAEIFTAPRNWAAWAACYLRAAFMRSFEIADWVEPEVDRLQSIGKPGGLTREDGLPDSYSLEAARDFIFAHECGHFFLDHLKGGRVHERRLSGQTLNVFDPALDQELSADRFARDVLCRWQAHINDQAKPKGLQLHVQQMGIDWLFGFIGPVLGMRRRANSMRAGHPLPFTVHPGIAQRRSEAWDDYVRRCAASTTLKQEHARENDEAVRRIRVSVDNFNRVMPAALSDIYVAGPEEVLAWQEQVLRTKIADGEGWEELSELARIGNRSGIPFPPWNWRNRLTRLFERWF